MNGQLLGDWFGAQCRVVCWDQHISTDGPGALSTGAMEAPSMDNKLSECVAALNDVRRSMQNDADPRIVAALSAAIAKLESCAGSESPTQSDLADAALGALGVISDIVVC